MRRIPGFIGAMVLGFVLFGSANAEAAFIAYVCGTQNCSGATDVMVTDNGTGDLSSTTGAILIAGTYFGYDLVINTSQSKPLVGSTTQPQMDIGYTLTNSAGTAGDIWLYATDTNFTGQVSLLGNLNGNTSYSAYTIDASIWGGSSNNVGDISNLLISLGPLSTPLSYIDSGSSGQIGSVVNPYSLTLGLHLFTNALGTTTGDLLMTSVPEPASLLLLGLGLLGGGAAVRRRRRRNAA